MAAAQNPVRASSMGLIILTTYLLSTVFFFYITNLMLRDQIDNRLSALADRPAGPC